LKEGRRALGGFSKARAKDTSACSRASETL
jgi:hypothetical protein